VRHSKILAADAFTADAEFTNVAGIHVKGAAEIEKFMAAGFATRLKAATSPLILHLLPLSRERWRRSSRAYTRT
jgi:hypothetical protein